MWRGINEVIAKNGIYNVNFQDFMANSVGANWNVLCIIYGSIDPQKVMIDKEYTCLLHCTTSLNCDTDKYIKAKF